MIKSVLLLQELASEYPQTWQKAFLSHVTKPFQAVRAPHAAHCGGQCVVYWGCTPNDHRCCPLLTMRNAQHAIARDAKCIRS